MTMVAEPTNEHMHDDVPVISIPVRRTISKREGMQMRRRTDKWMTAFVIVATGHTWFTGIRVLVITGDVWGACGYFAFATALTVISCGMVWQALGVSRG